MRRLSILALPLILGASRLSAAVPEGQADHVRPPLLVLFGARWCAPCMVEYRTLSELIPVAAPVPVVLAWIDREIAPPVGLEKQVGSVPEGAARRLARDIAGEGYGLPFSALFDAKGKPCALLKAPLKPADVTAMRSRCGL
jgi:thiol-disulfide isomerase/thioredoxin